MPRWQPPLPLPCQVYFYWHMSTQPVVLGMWHGLANAVTVPISGENQKQFAFRWQGQWYIYVFFFFFLFFLHFPPLGSCYLSCSLLLYSPNMSQIIELVPYMGDLTLIGPRRWKWKLLVKMHKYDRARDELHRLPYPQYPGSRLRCLCGIRE